MAKSRNAAPKKKAAKKSSKKAAKVKSFDAAPFTKAGFEESNGPQGQKIYSKGANRIEVSHVPGEKGVVEHTKYFTAEGGEKPVYHTNSGVVPGKDFLTKFTQ